jgi:hypothetical protein
LVTAALLVAACGDDEERPSAPPDDIGGSSGANSGGSGNTGADSPGGSSVDGGGNDGQNEGGGGIAGASSASGGSGTGGDATGSAGGGAEGIGGTPEPLPPEGDAPLCAHDSTFSAGTPLALSGSGDDVLQAITPFELTIAWKNGDDYFVADRADVAFDFEPPLEVVGGSAFVAVTLRSDGLRLIAVTEEATVVQLDRVAGAAFDAATAVAGDFSSFNFELAGSPEPNKVLADAVLNANDSSFLYSYFLMSGGSSDTVRESRRQDGSWSFSSVPLGIDLQRDGDRRRIPTGISSDNLTLFYRDEVNEDFRAAWRVNTQVQFSHSEALRLPPATQSAAPNVNCTRVYYSAPGAQGLDIFVTDVTP